MLNIALPSGNEIREWGIVDASSPSTAPARTQRPGPRRGDFVSGAHNRCRYCENKLLLMFSISLGLFMSYLSRFVNTCVCSVVFVGSGCRERDVYCIYKDFKKNKKQKQHVKISLLLLKKLMSSWMCQPFVKTYTFVGGKKKQKLLLHAVVVMAKINK